MASANLLAFFYCGREYEFLSTEKKFVEKYVCPICQEVLFEPVQTSCGHLYCEQCIKRSRSRSKRCPSCRAALEEEPRRDKFHERDIKNLTVKCSNNSVGCVWTGELSAVVSHVSDVCAYQLVRCPNMCGEELKRRDIEQHKRENCVLRTYKCPYCRYSNTYRKITTEHFDKCDSVPVDCPNSCGKRGIKKGDLSSHLALCPEEVVSCRYLPLGCKMRLPRKRMKDHINEKDNHLDIAMTTTIDLVTELNETKLTIGVLQRQMEALVKKTCTEISPSSLFPKPWLKEDPFPFYPPCTLQAKLDEAGIGVTPPFSTQPGASGYKLKMRVCARKSVFDILPVNLSSSPLNWPRSIEVNFHILNQDDNEYHLIRTCSYNFTTGRSLSTCVFKPLALASKFHRDGSVYIRVQSIAVKKK